MVRFKSRYLYAEYVLFPWQPDSELVADDTPLYTPTAAGLANAIRTAVGANFGLAASARINQSLSVKLFNPQLRFALVRCARDALPSVWFSVSSLAGGTTDAEGRQGRWAWRVRAVSGSLRGCQKGSFRSIRRVVQAKLDLLKACTRPEAEQWRRDLAGVLSSIQRQLKSLDP